MQIWNGCNARNITGNPIKDINSKLTFLSSRSKVERWLTPQSDWAGCHLKFFISDLALTWWKMIDFSPSRFWHLGEILEILILHVLFNDTCKFTTNLSPSAESILKMLIYYMLKDDWPPQSDWSWCHLIFFSLDLAWTWWMMIDFPFLVLTSGGNLGNSTFACTLQWCMQMCHKLFSLISWEPFENVNLLYFLL